jgi:hypothetical protein
MEGDLQDQLRVAKEYVDDGVRITWGDVMEYIDSLNVPASGRVVRISITAIVQHGAKRTWVRFSPYGGVAMTDPG